VTASRQLFIFLAFLLLAANYPEAEIDTATKPSGVTPENYDKIAAGMTQEEVEALLGCRPATEVTDAERSFASNSPITWEIKQTGKLWRSRKWRVWVVFDNTNHMWAKRLELTRTPTGAK